ncbi:hypothetical protein [Rhizobium leguminosarum]|uniref:hypothetical protein n=1 Tax=Rhizobium leguminosarum TaxID=384 RepID=UPI001C9634D6|nr:hypothetical protein [Rhizobium leguminosarum]MBY5329850.1 hypothetical protein [Rhizobium leguminosarum]
MFQYILPATRSAVLVSILLTSYNLHARTLAVGPVCIEEGINEERAFKRSSALFLPLTSEEVDAFGIDVALFSLVDSFCGGGETTESLSIQSFDEWTGLVNQSGAPGLFHYFALRFVSENEEPPPYPFNFSKNYLRLLAARDPNGLNALKGLFTSDARQEAELGSSGKLAAILPSYGAVAMYFAIHAEITRISSDNTDSR